MRCCQNVVAVAVAGLCLIVTTPAGAQGRRGGGRHTAAMPPPKAPGTAKIPTRDHTEIDDFARMSPEQRQKALAKLPPDRAEKLQKQLKEYSELTPQQQAAAREQLELFRQLPPERQDALRKAFNRFSKAPSDRQESIREELNQLRGLSPAERRDRMNSPEFKSRFSGSEQKMLNEMSNLLPER